MEMKTLLGLTILGIVVMCFAFLILVLIIKRRKAQASERRKIDSMTQVENVLQIQGNGHTDQGYESQDELIQDGDIIQAAEQRVDQQQEVISLPDPANPEDIETVFTNPSQNHQYQQSIPTMESTPQWTKQMNDQHQWNLALRLCVADPQFHKILETYYPVIGRKKCNPARLAENCPIDLTCFEKDENEIIQISECSHLYHKECFYAEIEFIRDAWINSDKLVRDFSCGVCKVQLFTQWTSPLK